MKLQELLEQKRKLPQNSGKTEEDLIKDLFNSQQAQISHLRKEINASRKGKNTFSLRLDSSGELSLQNKVYDKALDQTGVISKAVVKASALGKLENLLGPLIEMTQAMIKTGGLLSKTIHKERDDSGNYTKSTLQDANGNSLYQVNPTSRFKMLCWILENNDQAKQAVDTLSEVLKQYTKEYISNMSVTLKEIESPQPIKPVLVQSEAEVSQKVSEAAKAKAEAKRTKVKSSGDER